MATTVVRKKTGKTTATGDGVAAQAENSGQQVAAATPGFQPRYLTQAEYDGGRGFVSLRDWMEERGRAGVGFMPIPDPIVDYDLQRDPETGNYLSQSVSAQWHPAMQALGEGFVDTINQRLARDSSTANAVRDKVRAAAQPISYVDPRLEQSLKWQVITDPQTGQQRVVSQNTYNPVYETKYAPFFDPRINYV